MIYKMIVNDSALIGIFPIKIIKNITHALGNVAVGHAVGSGFRNIQATSERPLEKIQLRCMLLGKNRYTNKFLLEGLHKSRFPIPFISRLAAFPLCLIDNITFSQNSSKKDVSDDQAIIEFVITLTEFRINSILKLAGKIAWLAWTNARIPDRSTNNKLYPSHQNDLLDFLQEQCHYYNSKHLK